MVIMSNRLRYRVEGMDCASCARKIETALARVPGVSDIAVTTTTETLRLQAADHDTSKTVERIVRDLGYRITSLDPKPASASAEAEDPHAHGACLCCDGPASVLALQAMQKETGRASAHHDHGHGGAAHGHDHSHGQSHAHSHGHGHDHDHAAPLDSTWWRTPKGRLTIAAGAGLAAAWAAGQLVPAYAAWAYILAMAVGLVPIVRRAFTSAYYGAPFTIEMLMTIAALGAVVIGAAEEAAVVVFLFLVGELLEGVAAGRARASIRALTDLVPKTAHRERNGVLEEVHADSLAVGDIILARPGDRIPADGTVVSGESAVDEAPVTGESLPKRKREGDAVFAGTINTDAALRVQVTAAARDNTIARIVRLVEEAQEAKAPTERFIDRFSRYYTPGVLVVGALVAIAPPLLFGGAWGEWVYKGLAVLLIGCPCALVISTPAAIAAGLAAGARRGLLIKGGAVLEMLRKITAVALDKTGTLTEGRPQVTDIVALQGAERDVLRAAAALDATSSHPIAKAILARAAAEGIEVKPADSGTALGGKGVAGRLDGRNFFLGSPKAAAEHGALAREASEQIGALQDDGKTVSVLLVDGAATGLIAVRDEPRADAVDGIRALSRRGIKTVMLTGDNSRTAKAIGGLLGVIPFADLLPADKLRIVNELKRSDVVAKVGDGINDAPALAAADVGIAMGGGTDVALETADAAVLHGRVIDVARMIALSQDTMANIRQNITIALGLKGVFLVTTILGVTGLWPAILADTGATVLVTANAMRLLGAGRRV
jgi:Cd2+/Zn2+-exporting ATPase